MVHWLQSLMLNFYRIIIIVGLVVDIYLVMWGYDEVFVNSPKCPELHESGLWIVGVVYVIGIVVNILWYIWAIYLFTVGPSVSSPSPA